MKELTLDPAKKEKLAKRLLDLPGEKWKMEGPSDSKDLPAVLSDTKVNKRFTMTVARYSTDLSPSSSRDRIVLEHVTTHHTYGRSGDEYLIGMQQGSSYALIDNGKVAEELCKQVSNNYHAAESRARSAEKRKGIQELEAKIDDFLSEGDKK